MEGGERAGRDFMVSFSGLVWLCLFGMVLVRRMSCKAMVVTNFQL